MRIYRNVCNLLIDTSDHFGSVDTSSLAGVLVIIVFFHRALNADQQRAFNFIRQGHNGFITGKAGTGKTYLLSHIFDEFIAQGKNVSVTCTTGIACKSLPSRLKAVTLHSFAGIKEGRGSRDFLLNRVRANDEAILRWQQTDLLIIDEVSMMSSKLFDIIEYIARKVRNKGKFFGSMQVVASGDFYQLPPVPNFDDEGQFAFLSPIWKGVFPYDHSFVLEIIVRQKEPDFIAFVNEIRKGFCSPDGISFSRGLGKRVDPTVFGSSWLTQIYSTNDEVDYANFERLEAIEGDLHTWRAQDTGDKKILNRYIFNCVS